jgi:hypothetical protein
MNIHVQENGQQKGTFNEEELRREVEAGRVGTQSQLWWEGQSDWLPCAQTPFAGAQSARAMTPAFYPQAMSPQPAAPVIILREGPTLPSNVNATIGGARGSGLALAALACGIMSFFFFVPCIPAIILGHLARGQIRRDPSLTGRGMATAGMVIGYIIFIGSVVSVLALLFGAAFIEFRAMASHPVRPQ